MPVPTPRGQCSDALLRLLLRDDAADVDLWHGLVRGALAAAEDVVAEEDLQLALWVLYALHLHGLEGVDDRWEWHPGLVAGAADLEAAFEQRLRALTREALALVDEDGPTATTLLALTRLDLGPSVSKWLYTRADAEQVREFLVLKSIYQLKEADPHTFVIPRLQGRAKAAAVEIQGDEYGNGDPPAVHSALFALAMRNAGLSDRLGEYVDLVPVSVLAADNAAVMFGLHRRLRGAVVGHLAAIEMTSTVPMRRYAAGIERVGLPREVSAYFREHVLADAAHEQVALHEMVIPFVQANPHLRGDVLLGAAGALMLDARLAGVVLDEWGQGRSALRMPLPPAVEPASVAQAPLRPAPPEREAKDTGGVASTTGITVCQDGPLLVRGRVPISRTDGERLEAPRRTTALCRCGRSGAKPHCDGTHHRVGFTAP